MHPPEYASILAVEVEEEDVSTFYGIDEAERHVGDGCGVANEDAEVGQGDDALRGAPNKQHALAAQRRERHGQPLHVAHHGLLRVKLLRRNYLNASTLGALSINVGFNERVKSLNLLQLFSTCASHHSQI